ncbi:MAG: type IV secretion system DNA-binding domain-containing protein [Candidatus Harrisonbacteria bacterium]|nr:type IV secretion system DNA-binding domain-containing protein [Candidatus Harrisonbacteria bacterium]
MNILLLSYIVIGIALAGTAFFWVIKIIQRKYFLETLKLRVLLVKLPQKLEKETKENEPLKEINLTGQLLNELSNLKIPFALEAAVHNIGEEIHFYLSVPKDSIQFAMRQIQGLWNDASVQEVEDYNIFNHQGVSQGVYLKQKETYVLPIRTYEEANLDTFLPILSTLSKIQEIGEGVSIQVLVKPAPQSFKKAAVNFVYQLKKGAKLEEVLRASKMITLKDIQKALKGKKPEEETAAKPILDEETIKAIEKKLAKQIFSVNVRLVVSAPSQPKADELLNALAGSFEQFEAPLRNGIRIIKPKNQKEFLAKYIFRKFDDKERVVLGTDELASLIHLPTSATETPKIKWLKAREAAPPTILPKEGTLIGESAFRGERRPVFITDEDRRRHIYLVGQTGTGKSNLMINMALNDIQQGKGVTVIDPHGDLIEAILGLIPENRAEDVIVFDPGDLVRPLGLNMLEYDFSRPEEKTFIVNEMQGIFNKLFAQETMGPIFEQYMRNALLLLMEDAPNEPATLMDVPRIFTDAEYREKKLARCQNPVIKNFWEKEAMLVGGEASLQNMTPYITSKFNNFIANDYLRPIIGQPKSAFRFREVMDNGKILLVNLSKGRIGDINAGLLGMIIVGKLLMAALSRVDLPQEERRDFNLYIDEFQNFTTDSISIILSEARKYRLNLVMAHQFIAQLQDKTRDAVFGNVGSLIVFRVGAKDAEELIKQFEPIFTKNDLINIDNFNAYVKLLINGETAKPFNIQTLPSPRGDTNLKNEIKELSRNTYGMQRG